MRLAIALAGFSVLAACDAYDEDLGPEPFLCGDSAPRCPMGYKCVEDPASLMEVCATSSAGSGGGSFPCNDDSAIEPNDAVANGTPTGLDGMKMFQQDKLAICPPTDRDLFAIKLSTPSQTIDATVTYDPSGVALTAEILNSVGVPIAESTAADTADTVHVAQPSLPTGDYFVRVHGPSRSLADENNYAITIQLTGP